MPFPRMTTRRWMVAVVAVGSSIGGYKLWRRRCDFLDRAWRHEAVGETYRAFERGKREQAGGDKTVLEGHFSSVRVDGSNDPFCTKEFAAGTARIADGQTTPAEEIAHQTAMPEKYRRAARYPWLPVEPDPPEPE
jgi:hypothetical protein